MKPINFTYIDDLCLDDKPLLDKLHISKHSYVNHLTLPTNAFSPTNSEYLIVTKATKAKWDTQDVIRLNVLTCDGGICVTIPYTNPLVYQRYRSLLKKMYNQTVKISFPSITINYGMKGCGLYFTASDFKMNDPIENSKPTIVI